MNKLKFAKEELVNGIVPSYWKYFEKQFKDLCGGKYKNVPLLIQSQDYTIRESTRSQKNLEISATYREEIDTQLKKEGEYVDKL